MVIDQVQCNCNCFYREFLPLKKEKEIICELRCCKTVRLWHMPKVHYAILFASTGQRTRFGQVRWCSLASSRLFRVANLLASRIALSRRVVIVLSCPLAGSLCFDVLARWTLENNTRTNLFDTFLIQIFIYFVLRHCVDVSYVISCVNPLLYNYHYRNDVWFHPCCG